MGFIQTSADRFPMGGIRAEVVLQSPEPCPVAAASADVEGSLRGVRRTPTGDGRVTEQVVGPEDADIDGASSVFDYGDRTVHEFHRAGEEPCVCELVERTAGPITEVQAIDGSLQLTIHCTDVAALRSVIASLREEFGPVSVTSLVRGESEAAEETSVVAVDLERLTERQREVAETAHDMGYFAYPREANAEAVAEALGIEPSTFAEHLAAAQATLMAELTGHESATSP